MLMLAGMDACVPLAGILLDPDEFLAARIKPICQGGGGDSNSQWCIPTLPTFFGGVLMLDPESSRWKPEVGRQKPTVDF